MPFRKLPNNDKWHLQNGCKDREHNPPGLIVLDDGVHEYTCPGCGHKQYIVVNKPRL